MAGRIKTSASPVASVTPTTKKNGGLQGEEVGIGAVTAAKVQAPDLPANEPFFLAVHPDRWVAKGGLVIPSFRSVIQKPGIEGNREGGGREMANRAADRGWSVIPHEHGPNGRSYLQAYTLRRDAAGNPVARHYYTCFDSIYPGRSTVTCDRKAMAEWVWSLVDSGRLPPPSLVGLQSERSRLSDACLRAAQNGKGNVVFEARAQELAASLAALDAVIARLQGAEEEAAPLAGESV